MHKKTHKRLNTLIDRIPASYKKNTDYIKLVTFFNSSKYIRTLWVPNKAHSLLKTGTIPPDKISLFYNKYSIKPDPFFPQYLKLITMIKQAAYKRKAERAKKITELLKKTGDKYNIALQSIIEASKTDRNVLLEVQRSLKVKTIKDAKIISEYDSFQLFNKLNNIIKIHRILNTKRLFEIVADIVLDCGLPVNDETFKRKFRELSLIHHPDRGGDAYRFNILLNIKKQFISFTGH